MIKSHGMRRRLGGKVIRIGSGTVIGLALLIFAGCGGKGQPPMKKAPLVAVETVIKGEIVHAVELTGEVEPYRIAQLASPAEGPVLNLRVREGDRVRAGDALLSIGRKKGVDALILSLREELKKEQDNLRRTRLLVEKGAMPGEELDLAKASFERARAELVKAQETARDYDVAAPWDGVISQVIARDGDFVGPRAPLLKMYDPESLVIRVEVPEKYAAQASEGLAAEVKFDAYPGSSFTAIVARVYPYLDERARTRTIELTIDDEIKLLPGMFCRVRLIIESVRDAITIPEQAVVITPAGASVVFVVADDKAVQRKVRTGIEDQGRVQVLSGLNQGDLVIVSGQEKLKDGSEVSVKGAPNEGPPGMSPSDGNTLKKKKDGGQ